MTRNGLGLLLVSTVWLSGACNVVVQFESPDGGGSTPCAPGSTCTTPPGGNPDPGNPNGGMPGTGSDGGGTQDPNMPTGGSDGSMLPTNPPPTMPTAARGATLPYYEYEAESATTTGTVIGPSETFGDPAAEASGRRAVKLAAAGQNVEFKLDHAANTIVVRYSIPDMQRGGQTDPAPASPTTTLGVYVNGVRKTSLTMTSRYMYVYGDADAQGQGAKNPGATPHHVYDEAHTAPGELGELPAGATVRLQKDAMDGADFYIVDLVDFEQIGPPLTQPAGSLSITDFGATANDASDDGPAIQKAIDAARTQAKVLWIPAGRFEVRFDAVSDPKKKNLQVANVALQGAGMWYSTLHGFGAQFKLSDGNASEAFADFAIFGDVTYRDDNGGYAGFDGPFGKNSKITNLWIEHENVGMWIGHGPILPPINTSLTQGLMIHGVRVRDTYADGINLANATSNSIVEQSHFRNNGDDALVTWSYAGDGQLPCKNNTLRFNTVQTVWRANCFAIYGGQDNKLEDNMCADTSNYSGILVSTGFTAIPFSGTTSVQRNTLTRAGGPHYGQEMGALRFFADQAAITGILVKDLVIDSSMYSSLHFGGSNQMTNITIDGVQVKDYGTVGIWVASEAHGSASLSNVALTSTRNLGLKNDTTAFTLQRGAGNVGW